MEWNCGAISFLATQLQGYEQFKNNLRSLIPEDIQSQNRPASQIFVHSLVCNNSTLLLLSLRRNLSVFIGNSLNTLAHRARYSELEDKQHHWSLVSCCYWLGNKESPAIPLIGLEHPL